MKQWTKAVILGVTSLFTLAACGNGGQSAQKETETVKLGLVGDDTREWDIAKENLADQGIKLEYVKFSDYNQPNQALAQGEVDLNAFQTKVYLNNFNDQYGADLVGIGNTVVTPLAIYSDKHDKVEDLPDGAKVSIPNDVTMGGRALILLESAGLIEVDDTAGITPMLSDITKNDKNLQIEEMDASQTPRSLGDVDIALINSNYAVEAGLNPKIDGIFTEPIDEKSEPYVNVVAARKEDQDNPTYAKVVDAYQTDETAKVIDEIGKGVNIAAWKEFGEK